MPSPRLVFAACAAALALPASGCGESGKGLLSAKQANKLERRLEEARRAVDDGKCPAAADAARSGAKAASQLASNVDDELRNNLVEGFNHLNDRVNADCDRDEEETPTPTETATEVPTEVPTETPTETPTEIPTEVPPEIPTEVPPEIPTEVPPEDTGGVDGGEG